MSWNYRVCRTKLNDNEADLFSIREVYCDEAGTPNGYAKAGVEHWESVDDLRGTLELMLKALDKPVIDDPL